MTDDAHCLAQMKSTYGRGSSPPIASAPTRRRRALPADGGPGASGREIMIDTYLALRADRFIGNGRSNVSAMIAVMKDWAPGA
jgi:hypothetical protein